jgi:hypothetical protein
LHTIFHEISALDEQTEGIEIVVCSNASTDGTHALLEILSVRCPVLRYHVNDRNLGIDGNIKRVVELARGTYVRLMSDDDEIVPGSLARLLLIVRTTPDLGFLFLNVARLVKDRRGVRIGHIPVVPAAGRESVVRLDPQEFIKTIGVWITFVTSFVFRRDLWSSSANDESYVGTDIFLSYKAIDVVTSAGHGYFDPVVSIGINPHFSGSYRVFKAFGPALKHLYLQHATSAGLDRAAMHQVFSACITSDLMPRVRRARVNGTFDQEERGLVMETVKGMGFLRLRVVLEMSIPDVFLVLARTFKRKMHRVFVTRTSDAA